METYFLHFLLISLTFFWNVQASLNSTGWEIFLKKVSFQHLELTKELETLMRNTSKSAFETYPQIPDDSLMSLPIDVVNILPIEVLIDGPDVVNRLASLILRHPHDHELLNKVVYSLRLMNDDVKVKFLDRVGKEMSAEFWIELGELLSKEKTRWWNDWQQVMNAMVVNLDTNESHLALLLYFTPPSYISCQWIPSSFCFDEKAFDSLNSTIQEFMMIRLADIHWPKMPSEEKKHRFRFWNEMLLRSSDDIVEDIIPYETSGVFLQQLYINEIRQIWLQMYEIPGFELTYKQVPLLKYYIGNAKANFDELNLKISKYIRISELVEEFNFYDYSIFHTSIDLYLDSRINETELPQSNLFKAILAERICELNMRDFEHIPIEKLKHTNFECLSEGQKRVIVNRLAKEKPLDTISKDLHPYIFANFMQNLTSTDEEICYHIPDIIDHEKLKSLLHCENFEKLSRTLSPKQVFNISWSDIKSWSKLQLSNLKTVPDYIASTILSSKTRRISQIEDDYIISVLIHGLYPDFVNNLPLISIERISRHYIADLKNKHYYCLNTIQIQVCDALKQRLSLYFKLTNLRAESNPVWMELNSIRIDSADCQYFFNTINDYDLLNVIKTTKYAGLVGWKFQYLHRDKLRHVLRPEKTWTSHTLAQLGDASSFIVNGIDSLKYAMNDMELRDGLKQVILESKNKRTELNGCMDSSEKIVEFYLRLENSFQFSVINSDLQQFPIRPRKRKRRDVNNDDYFCNINSLELLKSLYKQSFLIVGNKIANEELDPAPQIGPIVMEVIDKGNILISKALKIEIKELFNVTEEIKDTEFQELIKMDNNEIDTTKEVKSALKTLKNLFMEASRTLIIKGKIFPDKFKQLGCFFQDKDLYTLFPFNVAKKFIKQRQEEELYNLTRLVMSSDLGVYNTDSYEENSPISYLLSVLHFGSSSYTSKVIEKTHLEYGYKIVTSINSKINQIYQSLKSDPELASKVDYRTMIEKERYEKRLSKLISNNNFTEIDIPKLVYNSTLNDDNVMIFLMETLRLRYRIIKECIDILDIRNDDMSKTILDSIPSDIKLDLFPELAKYQEEKNSTTESLVSTTTQKINDTNQVLLFNVGSFELISCVLDASEEDDQCAQIIELLSFDVDNEIRSLIRQNNTQHKWFQSWINLRDHNDSTLEDLNMRQDKILLELTFIKILDLVNFLAQSGYMSSDDVVHLSMLMNRKRNLIHDKKSESDTEILNDFALRLAYTTSKQIIKDFKISIKDFSIDEEIVSDLMIQSFFGIHEEFVAEVNKTNNLKLKCDPKLGIESCLPDLYKKIMKKLEKHEQVIENLSSDNIKHQMRMIIKQQKIIPQDLGLSFQEASENPELRKLFNWYFKEIQIKREQEMTIIDSLFTKAKKILASAKLSTKQKQEVNQLQNRVNKDGEMVAEKYLNIDLKSIPLNDRTKLSKIMEEKIKSGKLSEAVLEEVKKFVLLQKVYITMKLTQILHLTKKNFDKNLILKIPYDYIDVIFHEERNGRTRIKRDIESGISEKSSWSYKELVSISFFMYQRAVEIASWTKNQIQTPHDISKMIDMILESQHSTIMDKIYAKDNNNPIKYNSTQFVLLYPVNESSNTTTSEEILKLQLKITKELILLLDLEPEDFYLISYTFLPSEMFYYLFNKPNESRENYQAIDLIFDPIVEQLKNLTNHQSMVQKTISIGMDQTVNQLSKLLGTDMINDWTSFETLLEKTFENGESKQIEEIHKIFYHNKVKTLKQILILTDMDFNDLHLPSIMIPEKLKSDLFENREMPKFQQVVTNNDYQLSSNLHNHGYFCISCFHELYESWKKKQLPIDPVREDKSASNNEMLDLFSPQGRSLDNIETKSNNSMSEVDFNFEKAINFLEKNVKGLLKTNSKIINDKPIHDDKMDLDAKMKSINIGLILHLYQDCIQLSRKSHIRPAERVEIDKLLLSQADKFMQNIPLPSKYNHSEIEKQSLGILIDIGNLTQTDTRRLNEYTLNFYLDLIRKMVEKLKLTSFDFKEIAIPEDIQRFIFPNEKKSTDEINIQTLSPFNRVKRRISKRSVEVNSNLPLTCNILRRCGLKSISLPTRVLVQLNLEERLQCSDILINPSCQISALEVWLDTLKQNMNSASERMVILEKHPSLIYMSANLKDINNLQMITFLGENLKVQYPYECDRFYNGNKLNPLDIFLKENFADSNTTMTNKQITSFIDYPCFMWNIKLKNLLSPNYQELILSASNPTESISNIPWQRSTILKLINVATKDLIKFGFDLKHSDKSILYENLKIIEHLAKHYNVSM